MLFIVAVRHRVKDVIDMLQDDERIRNERKNAKKGKEKYTGISSSDGGRGYRDQYDQPAERRSQFDDIDRNQFSRNGDRGFGEESARRHRRSFTDSPDHEDSESNHYDFDRDQDSPSRSAGAATPERVRPQNKKTRAFIAGILSLGGFGRSMGTFARGCSLICMWFFMVFMAVFSDQ